MLADDDVALGRKIRDLRQGRGLSIKEMALRSELSAGAISQIERGIGSTSLRSIRNICKALDVPLGILFDAERRDGESEFLRRFHQREALNLGHGTTKQKLTARAAKKLEMLAVHIEPGGNSGPESYSHEGEEMGLVLAGILDLYVADQRYQVREGDSFAFPSTLPHRFANSGNSLCRVLWVNSPALYPADPA
ncbi:MAG: cupin domain-containing protein [Parvibaculaceae bacterium]